MQDGSACSRRRRVPFRRGVAVLLPANGLVRVRRGLAARRCGGLDGMLASLTEVDASLCMCLTSPTNTLTCFW